MTDRPSGGFIARSAPSRKRREHPVTLPELTTALRANHGVHARAAEVLGVSRVRVTQLVGQYGLRPMCAELTARLAAYLAEQTARLPPPDGAA